MGELEGFLSQLNIPLSGFFVTRMRFQGKDPITTSLQLSTRIQKDTGKPVCSRCSPNISFGISWDNSLERMTSMFDCQEKLDIGHCCGIKGRWTDYLSPKASAGHRIFLGGPYALLGLVRSKHYSSLGETNFKLFCP